jgi:uncharacterized membrane protein YfcA
VEPALAYPILFVAGCVAGALNVVAGGGSFLTLPVLIFLGLPATVANGTNRVAILLQNAGAVWSFNRHRIVEWTWLRTAALPAVLGAIVGTWIAVRIDDALFQRLLATLMILFAVVTIWNPGGGRRAAAQTEAKRAAAPAGVGFSLAFFGVGVYGGFVQAGIGFVILAVATLAGLDLVRGNALKVLVVLVFTPVALALFAAAGKVDWATGLVLGGGNFVGGLIGVRLTVARGHAWVRRVVIAVIILFAIKLWVSP